MTAQNEMKPCPFCGWGVERHIGITGLPMFLCTGCGATVSFQNIGIKQAPTDYFNTRTKPPAPAGHEWRLVPDTHVDGKYTDDEYESLKESYEELDGFFKELLTLAGVEDSDDEDFYTANDVQELFRKKFVPNGESLEAAQKEEEEEEGK